MAERSNLKAIQPVPFFPLVAPLKAWAKAPEREEDGLRVLHAPMFYIPKFLKSLDGTWLYRSVMAPLTNLKQAGQLDIVDAHFGYPEGIGALMAARKLGVPCVVTLRGFEAEYLHKPLIGRQIKRMIRNVDGCICVGHFLKGLAIEHGANPDTTRVIHNAIDREMFYAADRDQARHELGLDTRAPIVISVGHLIPRKRHHVLVAAFAELLSSQPDARLMIIGDAGFEQDYARRLKNQIFSAGIGDSVSLLGNVAAHKIGDYLRAADVFGLGTQREGCCNAVLEALACGLPVVTTDVGDNSWFVKDDENGYIVPVDDSAAMASALTNALLRKDWDRKQISANLAVGDWDAVAAEVMEFFDSLLRSS